MLSDVSEVSSEEELLSSDDELVSVDVSPESVSLVVSELSVGDEDELVGAELEPAEVLEGAVDVELLVWVVVGATEVPEEVCEEVEVPVPVSEVCPSGKPSDGPPASPQALDRTRLTKAMLRSEFI